MLKRIKKIIGLVALAFVLNSVLVTDAYAATTTKKVSTEKNVSTKKDKVEVISKTLSIRKGASKEKKVVAKVKKGTKLTLLGSLKSTWVKVEYKGKIGYIYNKDSKYLKKVSTTNTEDTAIKNVVKEINKISSPITLDDKEQVVKARKAYKKLSSSAKKKVTNLSKLERAEEKIDSLVLNEIKENTSSSVINGKVEGVNTSSDSINENIEIRKARELSDKINKLNKVISLSDKAYIESLREEYTNSDAEVKELVTNVSILEKAESRVQVLLAEKDLADKIILRIAELDREITLTDDTVIESIRNDYESLPSGSKALVSNIEVLKQAETKLLELKNEYANAKMAMESYLVELDKLPGVSEVKLSDKEAVVSVRIQYENLNSLAKGMISQEVNQKLVDLESVVKALEIEEQDKANALYVEGLIQQLDKTIAYEDYSVIREARKQYNRLSAYAKSLVGNLEILEKAETEHAEILARVSNVLNLINRIPEELTLADKHYVVEARAAYEQLPTDEKSAITKYELSILTFAEEKMNRLETTSQDEVLRNFSNAVKSLKSLDEIINDKDQINELNNQIIDLKAQYYLIDESIRYAVGEEFNYLCELQNQIKRLESQQ